MPFPHTQQLGGNLTSQSHLSLLLHGRRCDSALLIGYKDRQELAAFKKNITLFWWWGNWRNKEVLVRGKCTKKWRRFGYRVQPFFKTKNMEEKKERKKERKEERREVAEKRNSDPHWSERDEGYKESVTNLWRQLYRTRGKVPATYRRKLGFQCWQQHTLRPSLKLILYDLRKALSLSSPEPWNVRGASSYVSFPVKYWLSVHTTAESRNCFRRSARIDAEMGLVTFVTYRLREDCCGCHYSLKDPKQYFFATPPPPPSP